MRINNQRVYRRSDQEMAVLAGGFPVISVDFYTSAVALGYLAALRREFQIPAEVELRVPGENDLPSRPPPGYIALSAEYFRAGLQFRYRATFPSVPEPVPDEVGPFVGGLLLLPGVQGNVCRQVSGLGQTI
ncbi:hypothetical protein TIFTF001_055221 [Ficus carica]|uniref:Uncharacterized protein n=1 Tax=Ficus carica TaxID=3494 RepID=A0AA88EFJ7_FICCA|nr:hypothetical protein TIFTF001_055221 [Ficus carica]